MVSHPDIGIEAPPCMPNRNEPMSARLCFPKRIARLMRTVVERRVPLEDARKGPRAQTINLITRKDVK